MEGAIKGSFGGIFPIDSLFNGEPRSYSEFPNNLIGLVNLDKMGYVMLAMYIVMIH